MLEIRPVWRDFEASHSQKEEKKTCFSPLIFLLTVSKCKGQRRWPGKDKEDEGES